MLQRGSCIISVSHNECVLVRMLCVLFDYTWQARIQDSEGGGGSYIQKGGGGGVRTGISGADPNCCRVLGKSTSKTKLQTAVGGGGSDHPKNPCIRACMDYVTISTPIHNSVFHSSPSALFFNRKPWLVMNDALLISDMAEENYAEIKYRQTTNYAFGLQA